MSYILLHGLGQTSSSWNETIQSLNEDWDILCPNLSDWIVGKQSCYDTLYKAFEKDDLSEYKLWDTIQIKKWLKCEPIDLAKERLDKYFYLTRELLVEKPNENNIDTETREMLSEIGKSKAHNIDNIIDKFKELEPSQIKEGFNILLPQIKDGKLENFIVKTLFVKFPEYRKSISAEIKNGEYSIGIADIPLYKTMYNNDKVEIKACLESLKTNGRISEKLYEKIVEGDE